MFQTSVARRRSAFDQWYNMFTVGENGVKIVPSVSRTIRPKSPSTFSGTGYVPFDVGRRDLADRLRVAFGESFEEPHVTS